MKRVHLGNLFVMHALVGVDAFDRVEAKRARKAAKLRGDK